MNNWPQTQKSFHQLFANDLLLQVVDTPGILDHSLEDRNTIEMQVSRVRVQSFSETPTASQGAVVQS
jgi:GTP1/Obg family GTP-binding protein